jgi:hypothetical protein
MGAYWLAYEAAAGALGTFLVGLIAIWTRHVSGHCHGIIPESTHFSKQRFAASILIFCRGGVTVLFRLLLYDTLHTKKPTS